ncbi:hypothetical protein EB052_00075 [bacterium]|nr:hypothetical protein [bacterium]
MEHNHHNQGNFIDPKKFSSLGFFSNDESSTLIFKKTEKIVAAIYLVSGLIKDNEPIRIDLREKALTMLSSALSLNSIEQVDRSLLVQTLLAVSVESLSLLNIASCSGVISRMNHEIISREIDLLITIIRERITEDVTRAGYILSDAFFKVEQPGILNQPLNQQLSQKASISTHAPASSSPRAVSTPNSPGRTPNSALSGGQLKDTKQDTKEDIKNTRQEAILNLLRKGLPLTIKDFSAVIKDCSEKTIQRELIELLAKGLIKKEGERRWSKYSI